MKGLNGSFAVVGLSMSVWLMGGSAMAQTSQSSPPAMPKKPVSQVRPEEKALRDQLSSLAAGLKDADPEVQKKSMQDLLALIDKNPAKAAAERPYWMGAMMETKHYQEVVTLTDKLLIVLPEGGSGVVDGMLPYRVEALLRLNKNDEALVAAKQYYNICSLKQSSSAISLVAQCLRAARPDDKDIDIRFRKEQQDRAATGSVADLDKVPPPGSSILDSIKVDSTPYDQAAAAHLEENFPSLMIRGTYALLADKPSDAKDFYERAYAETPQKAAVDGIARSIRDLHRSVGAANAWIVSLQSNPTTAPGH